MQIQIQTQIQIQITLKKYYGFSILCFKCDS